MTINIESKENTLESLKQSATFSMSRGSRELFHTNFLAFILETEGSCYVQEIKKKIIESFFDYPYPENVICFRERSSLDLILVPALNEIGAVSQVVVIEAKLKSIPTHQQLDKYTKTLVKGIDLELYEPVEINVDDNNEEQISIEKLKLNAASTIKLYSKQNEKFRFKKEINIKLKKILLAPDSFKLDTKNADNEWHDQSWEDLITSLEQVIFKVESNDLLSKLLNDYLTSTRKILNLITFASSKLEEFISSNLKLDEFIEWIMGNDFRHARLHDLIGKVSFNKLEKQLYDAVLNNINKDALKKLDFKLESSVFFTRSMPGLEIYLSKIIGDTKYKIGVQIQGRSYRHFICRDNTALKPSLIECALNGKGWMKSFAEKKFNEEAFNNKKNNGFGVFNKDLFVHLSADMMNDVNLTNYKGLVDEVAKSINNVISKLECQKFTDDFIGKPKP